MPAETLKHQAPHPASSLHYARLLVPRSARPALDAWITWCREVRSIPAEVHDPGVAATKLAWWTGESQEALAGHPHHPTLQALLSATLPGRVTSDDLASVIEGTRTDLEQTRFLDRPALQRYLALSGGVPTEVSAAILASDDARAYGRRLGMAAQCVRILRDVGADARQGRLYLPVSELQRHDVKAHEVLRREPPHGYSERFRALMNDEAAHAHAMFDEADTLLPIGGRSSLRPLIAWGRLHRQLLQELQAGGFQVLHQRVALAPVRKLWIATRVRWLGR